MVFAAYIRKREQWGREYLEPTIIGLPWEPIVLILLSSAKISKSMILLYIHPHDLQNINSLWLFAL